MVFTVCGAAEGANLSTGKLLNSEPSVFGVNAIQDIFGKYNDLSAEGLHAVGMLDLSFAVDLDEVILWDGLCFHINGMAAYSRDLAGQRIELAELSNIQSGNMIKLQELWLKQNIYERASFLLGIYDLNSEFDVNLLAGTFLNGSLGMGPDFSQSGKNGVPTFPDPALAFRVSVNLSENTYMQTVISDGVPGDVDDPPVFDLGVSKDEGALLCTELGYRTGVARMRSAYFRPGRIHQRGMAIHSGTRRRHYQRQNPPHIRKKTMSDELVCRQYQKAVLGIWYYSADFEPYFASEGADTRNWGGYILAEKVLWGQPGRLLGGFTRFGWTNPKLNPIAFFWSCGVVLHRFSDQGSLNDLGLAVASSCFSKDYRQRIIETGQKTDRQAHVIEFYWRFQVNEALILQPDVQYIVNIHDGWSTKNSLALGLRCGLSM